MRRAATSAQLAFGYGTSIRIVRHCIGHFAKVVYMGGFELLDVEPPQLPALRWESTVPYHQFIPLACPDRIARKPLVRRAWSSISVNDMLTIADTGLHAGTVVVASNV